MSIVEKLKAGHGFTAAEEALAAYILHHVEEVPRMTERELAERALVSKSAIARLCHKLGLDGYRSLRLDLATEIERRRRLIADVDADRPFTSRESCATVIRLLAELTREAVDGCYESVSPEAIDEVAADILVAEQVILYAVGDSCIVTQLFASKLAKLGINCVVAGVFGDYNAYLPLCNERTLVVFATYSGMLLHNLMGTSGIRRFSERGCKTVVITGMDAHDPALEGSDVVVSFPRKESQGGAIGPFYSLTCLNFVFNCIYARVYATDFEKYDQMKGTVDAINRTGTEH